jgi:hypothetical protein
MSGPAADNHIDVALNSLTLDSSLNLNTFQLFPRLPTELRLKVWTFTTPLPHILEIVWTGYPGEWSSVPQSRHEPYHAMRANKEAHENFLTKWTPFCLQEADKYPVCSADFPITYINPLVDTVYIGAVPKQYFCFTEDAVEALLDLPCIGELRHLACEIVEWQHNLFETEKMDKNWEIGFFSRFPKLEVFTIVDHDIDWRWINRHEERPLGVLEFVMPTQMDENNEDEIW